MFCLRYEMNNTYNFNLIRESHCLPFPCHYKAAFPQHYQSYSLGINKMVQKIRLSMTRVMCRTAQSNIGPFIKGYARFDCTNEFWTFFKFTCSNVQVHGPYNSSRKALKMQSFLDLCTSVNCNQSEIMHFKTVTDLNKFDSVFGIFARYGSVELRNKSDPTIMQENHRMSTFGSGLSGSESSTVLKQRSYTKKGIDFKYNTTTDVL